MRKYYKNIKERKQIMSGGYTSENPMDEEVRSLVMSQKYQIEAQVGKSFSIFVPVSYQTQVVAGINYRVRIAVDGGKNVYTTIYQALPCAGGSLSVSGASIM